MTSRYGLHFAKVMARLTFMEVAGRLTILQGVSCLMLCTCDNCANKANFMEHTRYIPSRVVAGKFSGSVATSFMQISLSSRSFVSCVNRNVNYEFFKLNYNLFYVS